MFNKRDLCKRVVATVLVFYFAVASCFTLLIHTSFAKAEELGKQQTDNFSNNVIYTVNFEKDGEDCGYEFEGRVDEEQLSINANIEVRNDGYLKNSKILIESEDGLSFDINAESTDKYQIEDNQIILSNISADEKTKIVLPICYKEKDDINNLNKKINVRLIGIYVGKNGEERSISENYVLRLKWNTNTEFNLTSTLKKYIPYTSNENSGVIVQTAVKSWISDENNYVYREEITAHSIDLDGYEIKKIIVANKSGENLEQSDWNYDEVEKTVTIKRQDETRPLESEEFLITYILSGEKELELPFTINSKINGSIFMFGTDEKIDTELEAEYEIEETVGNIITADGESTESIKMGNLLNNKMSEENQYKTNYETRIIADISQKEMVEGIVIKSAEVGFESEENIYSTAVSYKQVKIEKENFEQILGENGKIEIANNENEIISVLDKNTKLENNQYIADIDTQDFTITTSKPQTEGVISIIVSAEMVDTEYTYEELKTFSNLNINYFASVIYEENIENKVSDITNKIELVKPETKADAYISKDTLSTIAENDVEIGIKLNNTSEDIDLYKNPKFEIVFPEYVDDVNVSNIAIANSENVFKIEDSRIYKNNEGKIVLDIDVTGEQTRYNTNTFSNGTSIIINAKISLNLYTPTSKQSIEVYYTNENATRYAEEANGMGYSEIEVNYKAPAGVVSINKISNYEETGKTVTSVEQGKMTDKIEIFAESKIANMDIIVMNNNENSCDDVKILGRIPFKGNKDVTTGEDLGTTIDTELVSNIIEAETNQAKATIYYSENGDANEDLSLSENAWNTEIEDLSNVKSYLIVINDYEMKPGEILKYTYKYEIPENLEHNTNIYGSFKTIYNNRSNVATVKEVSSADVVGLTTGVGPQLAVDTTTNVQERVKEYEKIKYTIRVENTGSEACENVVVKTKIPEAATYTVHSNVMTLETAEGWELKPDRELETTFEKLNPGDIKKVEFFVQVNKLPTIEEYYMSEEGFSKNLDGTYSIQKTYIDENGEERTRIEKIDEIPEIKLVCESIITAKDLEKEMKITDRGVVVDKASLVAEEIVSTQDNIAKVNETIQSKITIRNNTQETMKNITVTKKLPEGLKYNDSYIRGYEDDGITLRKIEATNYDATTRTVTWTIDELEVGRTSLLIGDWVVGEMKDGVYKDTISTETKILANGEQYNAGQVEITVGRPHLEVAQVSDKTNQYVKVGDNIEYTFTIQNTGAVRADNVTLTDKLPNEVAIKKLTYTVDDIEVEKVVAKNEDAVVYTSIMPQGKLEAKVTAQVQDIVSAQKVITNIGNVDATDVGSVKSNDITNIIERTTEDVVAKKQDNQEKTNEPIVQENKQDDETVKSKYEIKGTAWLDENKNGIREKGEKTFAGLDVRLMNQATGELVEKNVTNIDGEYEFKNLRNGTYMVIFSYDNTKYSVTEYKKQGVSEDKNSDIITAKENNKTVAATDTITIKNGSKSNIDAGFAEATTYDLSLTKRISKVTVQTNNGTNTYNFNNTDLAKVDINAKYLNGAKVLVEYTFTVKNEGELEGYAKEIVDYMPKEFEFSTELNKNWYKGNDGNLYTDALANNSIPKGETRTLTLILTKTMTDTNTGIINNEAEISKDYNKAGIADRDSEPNDKDPKDDDMSSADLIIGVKTGDTLIYISAITAGIIATIIVLFILKKSKIRYKIQARYGKEV